MNIFDLFKKIEGESVPKPPVTMIVAGLGNPGAAYENTRHNAGFMAVDRVAEAHGVRIDRAKFRALVAECTIGGVGVLLMKPQTFMNLSGEAIGEAARFYKIPPERVLILHDEISFDPGFFRIRRKGSAGGHNGLKSIIAALSSEAFLRIKIGVGKKPSPDYDLADFVLGRFSKEDAERLTCALDSVAAAVDCIVDGRIEEAMAKYSK